MEQAKQFDAHAAAERVYVVLFGNLRVEPRKAEYREMAETLDDVMRYWMIRQIEKAISNE